MDHPSDDERALSYRWDLDHNRLKPGKDYVLNVGGGKTIWERGDAAEERLFERVEEEVFSRDTYRAFMQLLDNYDRRRSAAAMPCSPPRLPPPLSPGRPYPVGCPRTHPSLPPRTSSRSTSVEDRLTPHEVEESYAFLNECLEEPVGQYLWKYLQAKQKAPKSSRAFAQQIFKVWFKSFGRGEAKGASSGFEHVFLGEEDTTPDGRITIAGFHNWIQFYFEERCNHLDYRGYILPKRRGRRPDEPPDGTEHFLSVQFEWEGETKPVSGMFVGVSPEFELALYTLLYYEGGDNNKLHLGDVDVNLRVYRLDRIGCISSAFPEAADSLDA